MGMKPEIKLIANEENITELISDRLILLRITDGVGFESDMCQITLSNNVNGKRIKLPSTGAKLKIKIGYNGNLKYMGMFTVNEVTIESSPDVVDIKAYAASNKNNKFGKASIYTQKTRVWEKGVKLGEMVKKIAIEHHIKYTISSSIGNKVLPHIDQVNESDINLLLRITKQYGAIIKPFGETLVVTNESESIKAGSNTNIPKTILKPTEITSYKLKIDDRETIGTVIATYRDILAATDIEELAGEGEPILRLKHLYKDKQSAKEAATNELYRRTSEANELTILLPGRLDIIAEGVIVLESFQDGVNGEWKSKLVTHSIDSSGYRMRVQCVSNIIKKTGG
ncbi:MAG: hypothetical protein GY710_03495 [Desulfobacteraceae bacterium]|nr:hypothetical protein [Desulfobacteraceae bacterium]